MRAVIVCAVVCLVAVSGAAAVVKPKPWAWTPKVAAARVTAENPAVFGRDNGTLTVSRCVGVTRAGKGVFTGFRCQAAFDAQANSSKSPTAPVLFVKVRKVGAGQPCVALTSLADVPAACTNPTGTRTRGTRDDARNAMTKALQERYKLPFPYEPPTECAGFGAGFYRCYFGDNTDGPNAGHLNVTFFTSGPKVTVLNDVVTEQTP